MPEFLSIPLPLAELLHATLGPLADRLQDEGHPWADLINRVLAAYCDGRDEYLLQKYGTAAILGEARATTLIASESVCRFVEEIMTEEIDFDQWGRELGAEDGNASTDG